MYPQRLPIVDDDDGVWGDILRKYLEKEHYNDDTNNAANGGHKNVTIRAGTSGAGGAPLKLASGALLSTAEAGAIEFNTDRLYFTNTSGPTRQAIATYDTSGSTGDIYYRDASSNFTRLAIGGSNQVLTVSGGLPSWQNPSSSANFSDATFTLQDDGDATKQARFQLSGITTGTTRTYTLPNVSGSVYVSSGTDVSVADGGTGRSTSTTAYGLIAAGTTATGAQQTISPGTSGQFLKSAGASALASFASITAADFTGTTAQFNTALTDNDFATLAGNETLTNKTLTSPRVDTLLDTNGNTSLDIINTPSAVNHVYVSNQPTGAYPGLGVDGTDANIGFDIIPKGNGAVRLYAGSGNTPTIQAVGADTNLHLNLTSKGTGRVRANGVNIPTISSTDTLTNKTIDGANNTLLNVPWAAVAKPTVIAAGNTITEALSEVDMYPLVGATDIGDGKQFGAFAANALYSHPESEWFVPIPHAYNDIAYNNMRGGSVEIRVNGSVHVANGNNAAPMFAPDATYEFADYYGSTSDTVAFEITLHRTFFWGYRYGIQQTDWCRGRDITFEAYNGTSWTTLASVTNQDTGLAWAAGDAGGTGITKLRVTLTNFNNPSARITQIFLIGFNSELFSGTFLPRGGGQLYGDLQAPAVRTSLIRDTTHNISALEIYGVASAVNYLQVQNAATGNAPGVYAQGSGTNININLVPKGTGTVDIASKRVTSVADPTNAQDAATKSYVDANGGGIAWLEVTGTSQTAATNKGYIANNAALVTVTLPSTAELGKTVRIAGKGAGGWRVAQNSGQQIHFGNTSSTSGTGGRLDSTHRYDSVELVCITANTTWVVASSIGNINVT